MAIFRGRGGDGGTAAQAALTEVSALLDQATDISNDINADALLVDAAVVNAQTAATDASTSATNSATSSAASAASAAAAATSETNAVNAASTAATDAANLAAANVAAQTSADATAAANSATAAAASATAAATSETNSAASAAAAAASAALADEMVNIEVNVDATSAEVANYGVNLVELTRTNFGNVGKVYIDSVFSTDGTILLLLDNVGNTIDSFTLTTPFDVSGLSLANSNQTADPNGTVTISFDFSPDGLYYYAASGSTVARFTLTTPYDVSTALETAATAPAISTGLSMASITVLEPIQSLAVSPFGAGERIRILSIGDFANWAPPALLQSNELVPNLTRNNLDKGRISKDGLYWVGTERTADYIAVAAFSTAYDVTTQTEVNETVGVITDPDGPNFTDDPLKYVTSVYNSTGDDEVVTFELPLKTVTSLTALTNEFAVIDGTTFDIKSDALTLNGAPLEGGLKINGTVTASANSADPDNTAARTISVAIGDGAVLNGSSSVVIGSIADAGGSCVAIGRDASAVSNDVAIGHHANRFKTSGSFGVAVGSASNSGRGTFSTAVGYNTGNNQGGSTASVRNTMIGASADVQASGNNDAVSIGYVARATTDGVAVGSESRANSGSLGVAVGRSAVSGQQGVSIGANSDSSFQGVSVGYLANGLNSDTMIGANAGSAKSSGSENVGLGHYTWSGHATVSNYVILSDGSGNIRLEINDLGNGTFNGDFTATGNVTSNSDRRLKSNIEVIPDAMSKVEQLSGYTFDMYGTRRAGVIAQEVEEVLPEVVNTTEMGVKSVAYGNLTALLIEAVKELKAEVRDLKERLGE